ncbi:MAG: response regulator [Bacteroidales bacterium]|nr:response regulator [Bacteroidales bacterium]
MWNKITLKIQNYFPDFQWRTLKNLGIGKTMLLWFLAISLIPLASLSFINYLYYYQGLNILSKKSLFTTSQLRVNDLNNYFERADKYLNFLTEDQQHLALLIEMDQEMDASGMPPLEFITTTQYRNLTKQLKASFNKSWKLEGLYNILMIDNDGNIIFSLKDQGMAGENLNQGILANTLISQTFEKILQSGSILFSDLEYFPPSNGVITGFIGRPVSDSQGRRIGVMGIQITTEQIDRVIQYSVGFGSTVRVYMIGLDLMLRSVSDFGNHNLILVQMEDNSKTRIWQASKINASASTPEGKPIIEEVSYYSNSQNVDVMGLFREIDYLETLGVNWALIEEVGTYEAHAVGRELSTFAKISLVVTTIFVFIISLFVTRRFVTPIKSISAWAKQVALGELQNKDIMVSDDEVGEMKHTFNRLVSTLQQYADVSQSIALGDYTKKVPIRSKEDTLGKSMNEMVVSFKGVVKQAEAIASGDYSTNVVPRSDQDTLGISLFNMTKKLREASLEIRNQDWLKTGLNELSLKSSGEKSIKDLSYEVLTFLAHYLNSQLGLLFVTGDKNLLNLTAAFACEPEITKVEFGNGVVGQVAKEKKPLIFSTASDDLPNVNIGPSSEKPDHFIIAPILYETQVLGVIQLGSFQKFDEVKLLFLDMSLETIALAIHTARSRERVEQLLMKTQEQANELAEQKEELRQINEELEEQTKALRHSEENLQHQQEELRVINEELEERTKVLELQRDDIRKKNQALQLAQIEIKQKAEALEVASKYKSEFLANMSHELRTPLNSILALSELLATNKHQGMAKEEIEFANVINSSGKDLLELINDILDLSKVEAGKLEVDIEDLYLEDLEDYVKKTFSPLTNKRGIALETKLEKGLPERIETDPQRALQIIKNLLSNAIKFTEKGSVTFSIHRPFKDVIFTNPNLTAKNCLAFDVIDTGVGISEEKVNVIFEAFQQADGTVSRRFGGTGLGLTISRSLSRLLGGEIKLTSTPGEGSTFTLYLPDKMDFSIGKHTIELDPNQEKVKEKEPLDLYDDKPVILPDLAGDDRDTEELEDKPKPSDNKADKVFENKKILIVDDDMRNVFVLTKILEDKKVQIVIGKNGREGIEKLNKNPDTALVIMDIMMPEMDGYEAMQEIRKDKRFAKLPMIALTAKAMKGDREKCIQAGANDYLSKPVQPEKLVSLLRVWIQK